MKTTRIVLDALLSIMIVFEMFIQYTGNFLHEVIGFAFFATVVIHLILSAKWMKGTARAAKKGKLSARNGALAVMGILLAVTMVVLGVSSVAISDILSSAGLVWTIGTYSMWAIVHTISSYALCALVVVHLAMHWAFLASAFKVPYNPERRRAIGVGVQAVAALGVVALGVTAAREVLPGADAQNALADEATGDTSADSGSSSSSSASSSSSRKKRDDAFSQAPSDSGSSSSSSPSGSTGGTSSSNSAGSASSGSTASDICTLCKKRCPLSDPQCDKPYKAGLI